MNSWEETIKSELLARNFTSEHSEKVAAFIGSFYLHNFIDLCETLDVVSGIIGYRQNMKRVEEIEKKFY